MKSEIFDRRKIFTAEPLLKNLYCLKLCDSEALETLSKFHAIKRRNVDTWINGSCVWAANE